MRRRELIVGGATGMAALGGALPAWAQGGKELVLAGSLPLTGPAAETGLNVQSGYVAATSFLNEKLGGVEIGGEKYRIKLRLSDDASDPARAVSLVQKELDNDTSLFLGSFGSNILLPTTAQVERAGKLMVQAGGAADQIFTQGFKNIFGLFPRSTRQFDTMARFFASLTPKPATVSFVSTNDGYGKSQMSGAIASCEQQGFRVLDRFVLPEKPNDFSSVLTAMRGRMPDALVTTLHDNEALLLTRQMVATGTNVKMIFHSLGPQAENFRKVMGKYANGLAVAVPWVEDAPFKDRFFGDAKGYADWYRAKINRPVSYHSAAAAACVVTYVLAMQQARSATDVPSIRKALAAADFETLYGRIRFTPDGDGDPQSLKVGQVQAGRIALVFPESVRVAPVIHPLPEWQSKAA
ncbi:MULTISPECIES: amino acid ABC transporter substrate-binding protein [unclassified Variovorax]|uniref:amino acid ABC transporter substrate-binding protein n=1 Tax=unclassified Variovorax TaxID=663243 RepID=UPI0008ADE28E|nr:MULTISPECIES: amino acid ABC transporter substrate-binding protein [unclassified Variovorax]SEK17264.1 amino acid/amide ABC transporter substrate-binding protein, HAAT family [Variovorax sp. OK202]SFE76916.1 amino acid/amide ABC transporter substrate-binding protein, HAAT family [Variovorax sp. OK212]